MNHLIKVNAVEANYARAKVCVRVLFAVLIRTKNLKGRRIRCNGCTKFIFFSSKMKTRQFLNLGKSLELCLCFLPFWRILRWVSGYYFSQDQLIIFNRHRVYVFHPASRLEPLRASVRRLWVSPSPSQSMPTTLVSLLSSSYVICV